MCYLNRVRQAVSPLITKHNDGSYFVTAHVSGASDADDIIAKVLIHDLREPSPRSMPAEELSGIWSGKAIALTRRHRINERLQ
ncbi:MAG: hypothetical protein ACRBBR_04190 [Cellvibrionaceae bacterium]